MRTRSTTRLGATLLAPALLAACTATPPSLYDGLGKSGREVTTDSELAQEYFDQGLALCWGFNHDEALRSFQGVARLDPTAPWRTGEWRTRSARTSTDQ